MPANRCLALDIKLLVRAGVVRPDVDHQGTWEWRDEPGDEKPSATIAFTARTGADGGTLRLQYSVEIRRAGGERVQEWVDQEVRLVTTILPSGGRRWWFQCPARRTDNPVPCRRRVGKLFLPGGGRIFACRHCYELAYESSRNSSRGSRMLDELGAVAGIPGWVARRLLDNECGKNGGRRRRPARRLSSGNETGRRSIYDNVPDDMAPIQPGPAVDHPATGPEGGWPGLWPAGGRATVMPLATSPRGALISGNITGQPSKFWSGKILPSSRSGLYTRREG